MKTRLLTFCDSYWANPELYVVHDEETLKYRYRNLQLRDTSELRLNNICATEEPAHVTKTGQGADSQ